MNFRDNPTIESILIKAEEEIKAMTGYNVRVAIDALSMNKHVLKRIICEHYKEPWETIISRSRPRELSDAMFIYMYIAKKILKCTLREIGQECGGRDHATVINAIRQINNYKCIKDNVCFDLNVIEKKFIKKMIV